MKNKDIHIKITNEEHQGLKKLAIQEKWSMCQTGQEAVKYYLKARKVLETKS